MNERLYSHYSVSYLLLGVLVLVPYGLPFRRLMCVLTHSHAKEQNHDADPLGNFLIRRLLGMP